MGNSKHRKKHKVKLQQRKNRIAQAKQSYNKFIKLQMEAIREQMANGQSTAVDLGKAADDTSENTTNDILRPELEGELKKLEEINGKL